MDRLERFYKIDQMLQARRSVAFVKLQEGLGGLSRAQLKRDLVYMKDRFHAPIEYDRETNGYRFVKPGIGPRYELPGLWFSPAEIYALLTMQQLLENLQPGLLTPHVKPLLARLSAILGTGDHSHGDCADSQRQATNQAGRAASYARFQFCDGYGTRLYRCR